MSICKAYFLSLIFTILLSPLANSSELEIYSAEFEPFTYRVLENGVLTGQGVMYEVVAELSRRVQSSSKIQFLPWNRVLNLAASKNNIGIIPLARDPSRENNYKWLAHVLDDPYVVFGLRGSKVDISSWAALKNARVGVFMGSLAETYMRKNKIPNVKAVSKDIQSAMMLKSGRIDAWVAPKSFGKTYAEKVGLKLSDLVVGMELTILHEYLAASKDLDPLIARKWELAFASMKRDGTYAAIMKKYGMEPVP